MTESQRRKAVGLAWELGVDPNSDKQRYVTPGAISDDPVQALIRNTRALWIANIFFYLVIIILIVVGGIAWTAMVELRQISIRLSTLEQFEIRISAHIDLVSNSLQERMKKIDQRSVNIQSTVDNAINNFKAAVKDLDFVNSDSARASENRNSTAETNIPGLPQASPLFRRVVTPDGKIKFEKTIPAQEPDAAGTSAPVVSEKSDLEKTSAPDYSVVARVEQNNTLNVRSGPSTDYEIIGKLTNGERVKNLKCVTSDGVRWCQIEPDDGQFPPGWVNGLYLVDRELR